jgi:hypothetical protein
LGRITENRKAAAGLAGRGHERQKRKYKVTANAWQILKLVYNQVAPVTDEGSHVIATWAYRKLRQRCYVCIVPTR